MCLIRSLFSSTTLLLLFSTSALGQAFEGVTLIAPNDSTKTFLIGMQHNVIRTWNGKLASAAAAYLLSDGSILRTYVDPDRTFISGGASGGVQIIDSLDNVVWDYLLSDDSYNLHHDIEPLPNGNVLLLAWERKTEQEAIAAGRVGHTGDIWPTYLLEVEPVPPSSVNIVWEWHLWDHLIQDVDSSKDNFGDVGAHPELVDINFGTVRNGGDWVHINAINYSPELDQIVMSSPIMNEIYVIDHSTMTAEAAGHTGGNSGRGGDILYRWGNPQAYRRGDPEDQQFFGVHGVYWIGPGLPGAGNLLLFNNGDRPDSANDYSSVEELVTPVDGSGNYAIGVGAYGPSAPVWLYSDPPGFFSSFISNARRLPNGNTLICEGTAGYIFEVTSGGTTVWDYSVDAWVFAVQRYWNTSTATARPPLAIVKNHPNPFNPRTMIEFTIPVAGEFAIDIYNSRGELVENLLQRELDPGRHSIMWDGRDRDGRNAASGIYVYRLTGPGIDVGEKMTLVR